MEREAVKKCKPTQISSRKTATTDAGSAAHRPICMQRERPRPRRRRRSRSRRRRARYIQRRSGGGMWRRVESLYVAVLLSSPETRRTLKILFRKSLIGNHRPYDDLSPHLVLLYKTHIRIYLRVYIIKVSGRCAHIPTLALPYHCF